MNKRFLFLLGICQKSGYVKTGEETCERIIASGNAKLIILATDASCNTKKKFNNKSKYYNVPLVIIGTREIISKAVGKINRPTIVITNAIFAKKLLNLLELE